MIKIGEKAPNFKAKAVVDGLIKDVSLYDFSSSYKVLVFYPLDFTFVCPTELHSLQEKMDEFKSLDTQILAISVDSVYSHLAWLQKPKEKAGINGVTYPLVSDITKSISRAYGVLDENESVALRGTFILDKENNLKAYMVNGLSLGRNVEEILRLIKAIKHTEKNGEVCPANWSQEKESLMPTQQGVEKYFSQ